jgi:hypothetical protein
VGRARSGPRQTVTWPASVDPGLARARSGINDAVDRAAEGRVPHPRRVVTEPDPAHLPWSRLAGARRATLGRGPDCRVTSAGDQGAVNLNVPMIAANTALSASTLVVIGDTKRAT